MDPLIGHQPVGAIQGVIISAVSHEGLTVTVDGKPARLAILSEDGQVVAAGPVVAREAEAVAVNSYRHLLQGRGHLRILSKPITFGEGPSTTSSTGPLAG
jgi:hypothetical protein